MTYSAKWCIEGKALVKLLSEFLKVLMIFESRSYRSKYGFFLPGFVVKDVTVRKVTRSKRTISSASVA